MSKMTNYKCRITNRITLQPIIRLIAMLLIMSLLLPLAGCDKDGASNPKESQKAGKLEADEIKKNNHSSTANYSKKESTPIVGDTVIFGHYEQDGLAENGLEPIEWLVLSVEDGRMLLLARCCLDVKKYQDSELDEPISWKNSTIRSWLNSEFLNQSFSKSDVEAIVSTSIAPDTSSVEEGLKADGTNDKVFLLSVEELEKYLGDSSEIIQDITEGYRFYNCEWLWKGEKTNAVANLLEYPDGWWLRSKDSYNSISIVRYDGYVTGKAPGNPEMMIRPAMWVDAYLDIEVSGHISKYTLDRITEPIKEVFPMKNGYAMVITAEKYQIVSYLINHDGSILRRFEGAKYSKERYLDTSDDGFLLLFDQSYTLFDEKGREVCVFDKSNSYMGAPCEGLIMSQRIKRTVSGDVSEIVYYNMKGEEILCFPGMVHLDAASNFHNGRALVKSEDTGNIYIIDTVGNIAELVISNKEVVASGNILAYIQDQVAERNDDFIEPLFNLFAGEYVYPDLEGEITIKSVSPFLDNEEYASAIVNYQYYFWHYYPQREWQDEHVTKETKSISLPALISRNGDVIILDYVEKSDGYYDDTGSVSRYCCNHIILDGRYVYSYDTNSVLDTDTLQFYIDSRYDDIWTTPNLYLVDDGTIYMTYLNQSKHQVWVLINGDGEIIVGPHLVEKQLNLYDGQYGNNSYCATDSAVYFYPEKHLDLILSRNGIYRGYDLSDYNKNGYYNLFGEPLLESDYPVNSEFVNNHALVCLEKNDSYNLADGRGLNLAIIDEQGNQVFGYEYIPSDLSHEHNPLYEKNENEEATIEKAIRTILSTDQQFRIAMNAAVLPVGVGETLGYVYDLATFDIVGLITHAIDDVSRDYRNDAADLILKSLLRKYEDYSISGAIGSISSFLKSDDYKEIKNAKASSADIKKKIEFACSTDEDLTWWTEETNGIWKNAQGFFTGIDIFGKYIDDLNANLDEKLMLMILSSNYEQNSEYLNRCIANTSSSEMKDIYTIANDKLESTYAAYLNEAYTYLEGISIVETLYSNTTIDALSKILQGRNISVASTMKNMNNALLTGKGFSEDAAKKITNAYFLAHSIAVTVAEKVGTDDTYKIMQDLYENAIVVNAMVEDIVGTVSIDGWSDVDAINKSIALGQYRLIVLDNLEKYRQTCSSGDYFLDVTKIQAERYLLTWSIEQLQKSGNS